MRRLLSGLIALVLLWPATGSAWAAGENADQAQALLSQGVAFRKAGDDERALAAFEQAFALGGSAQAMAQRALAEQALGRWLDAHQHLEEALKREQDPWIVEHRLTLSAALGEIASQLGALEVSCDVPGAEIRLDGRLLGHTPLPGPLRTIAGRSVVQVSAPGYFEVTRQVQIDAGGLSRVGVTLVPEPMEREPPAQSNTGAASAATKADAQAKPADSSARDTLMYASLGLGALGVTVGVAGLVIRQVNVSLYNDDARCDTISGVRRSDECPDEAAAYQRGEALAIGGFAAAGVFGGVALYLWLSRPEPGDRRGVSCAPGLGLVSCSGRF